MSAQGNFQTSARSLTMSALPQLTDIAKHERHVRKVPKADAAITYIERFLRGPRLASTESGGVVKIILSDSNRTRRIHIPPALHRGYLNVMEDPVIRE